MPWYKVWSCNRNVKKCVKAESLDEVKQKGSEKLGIPKEGIMVVDERDGTDIDDYEMLLDMAASAALIIQLLEPGQTWAPQETAEPLPAPVKPEEAQPTGPIEAPGDAIPPPTGLLAAPANAIPPPHVPLATVDSQSPTRPAGPGAAGAVSPNAGPAPGPAPAGAGSPNAGKSSPEIAAEVQRAPLPDFDPLVRQKLASNESEVVWNMMLRQSAAYYFGRWPEIDDSGVYRIIGQKMLAQYPCVRQEGVNPWTLFTKGLSQRIRHLRHDLKRKSGQACARSRGSPCFKPSADARAATAVASPEDIKRHMTELKKEWAKEPKARQVKHIKLIIEQTAVYRTQMLKQDDTGRIAPIMEAFPCFEDGGYLIHAFKHLVGMDKAATASSKMGHIMRASELLMGIQGVRKGRLRMLPVVEYLEEESKFGRVSKGKNKTQAIINVHEDVADADVAGLLSTREEEPLHLVAFLRNKKLAGIYVVGDTIKITVPIKTVETGIFTVLAAYYIFNVEYPRLYAMVLGVFQTLAMQEPYMAATSKGYAFLVKKMREAMEKTPDTSADEDADAEQPKKMRHSNKD